MYEHNPDQKNTEQNKCWYKGKGHNKGILINTKMNRRVKQQSGNVFLNNEL